jgi:hypothetical protein
MLSMLLKKNCGEEKLLEFYGFNMIINPHAEEACQGSNNQVFNVITVVSFN